MITCTRTFGFDAGHRIVGHEGKCRNLHGHRYTLELTVKAPELDSLGRVIDFGRMKELVGGWIDRSLDHNMILFIDDPIVQKDINAFKGYHGRDPVIALFNPTAENLARFIFEQAQMLLMGVGITVVKTKLWETPNCFAEYEPDA